MVQVTQDELIIRIKTSEPHETRESFIMAIAAAMRWCGTTKSKYKCDGENQVRLARLLEELTTLPQ